MCIGAGLAMAYRIVEMHNGRIEIESKVGVGTQVDIRLLEHQGNE
ncbi:MAG: signal transduction histidine kinase [Candidatus Latescibacterota bacterium]